MSTPSEDSRLSNYARKLRWALSALPEGDRDDIVAEMRSHVLDRLDSGVSIAEALSALGDPDAYAKEFNDAYAVSAALSSRRTSDLVVALLQGGAGSLAVTCAGLVIVTAWSAAALIAFLAVLKIRDPAHIGLWSGQHFFFMGVIDDPSTGRELLGLWITPLALVCVVAAWVITRSLSIWALRRLPKA